MELYNKTTLESSKVITQLYSTSFTLGIKTLSKELQSPIYAIYAYVRYADEIVDTFHTYNKRQLLKEFKEETYKTIASQISLNPVLHSFQLIVNQYKIDHALIEAFLVSMEMDLEQTTYDQTDYQKYIYGSAEVVGLMCLSVFCNGNKEEYEDLKPSAQKLGSAFQKINFLRDMSSDFEERGRTYFPTIDFKNVTAKDKLIIENDIDLDFQAGLQGIKKLPNGAKLGVYLAYTYYIKLFQKIKTYNFEEIKSQRIRISDTRKIILLIKSYLKFKFNAI
ncbi:MAG: phytoene/squalene synthase family protein [Pseudarcicella sp.]|nr:phytoene/squalene synthase family protein [Pseudarcicella sp.]MBP6411507.1 phytoene/squalene synthase family protein [Pseudarcicella sp.]